MKTQSLIVQDAKNNTLQVERILETELNEVNSELAINLLQEAIICIDTIRILHGWKYGKQY